MRSRMLGVLSVCIGTGPIGFVWLGWLADRIGAPQATAMTGVMGLLALAATRPLWRGSEHYRRVHTPLMLLSPARGRGWVRGLHEAFEAPSPSLSP